MRHPAQVEEILDALSKACLGDTGVRIDVDPEALDDPLGLVSNAINLLLEDLEYRQREREEALRRVAGLQAKEEFLAYLSHDMQTPMAVLLGGVTVLESSTSQEDVSATLPLMQQAIERLQRFVRQFLDLARLESDRPLVLRPTDTELLPVVQRTARLFADDGPIEIEAGDDLPLVEVDAERVEQILANLFTNAFKYAGVPRVLVRTTDDAVEVVVADEGPGLDPAELERVFGKFERGAAATGSGLGLYISRALARAQGGELTATSVPGDGTRFTLRLPLAR